MLKEIPGFNGKYVMNENKEVFNKKTGKVVKAKIRGASANPSYRLYGSGRIAACKTVESWFRIIYPELIKIDGYKDIPGFEGKYGISRQGDVYSYALKRTIVAYPSKTSDYLYVELSAKGETKHYSVHRLVAMTYLPNPKGLPEVDHIDRNIRNNNVENLRWTDRTGNLRNSSCGFLRNFRECILVHNGEVVKRFKSIKDATVYGSEHFGASRTGLERNLKSKGCEIKSVTTSPMGRRAESDYRSKCDTPKG